ncbi:MAG: GNAT family N-acetyltransferase [Rubrivivax sp.]|jgi:acyl-CoA hydrolase/GNAT superfamily N-acetyltransferase|nr:GNAT family N-acetyltransferase [Rubrivivax sp.]
MNDSKRPTGFLSRLARGLRQRFGAGDPESADAALVPPRLQAHAHKLCSAAEAIEKIRRGEHVFVGSACATPRSLVAALEARPAPMADVELVHFLTDHAVPHDAQGRATTHYRHRCFFVGSDMRAAVRQSLADYVPVSLAQVPHLIHIGRIPIDVALIQVSLPDAFGYVSLGVSVDIIPAAMAKARLVIAEINPSMPNTVGDTHLHLDAIHHLVPVDTPVIEYQHPAVPGPVVEQIARYISGIIDDGSTLQIGMGRVTNEALKLLGDRRDLGIHSDVITDAIIPLLEGGSLTGRHKTHRPGQIVASLAMGSRKLYDLIDGNPRFNFQPIDDVCRPEVLAAQHKLVSVTQAFAVDLSGQVCADQLEGDYYSGLAAQVEFLRAAAASPGGKAIICLASTDPSGKVSAIRTALNPGEGATIARSDVHFVVTEYGIAYLFGKSMRERAIALIEVAHPDFRSALFEQAKAIGVLPPDQLLKHMQAYAVEDERTLTLKDQRSVLMRPAGPIDAEGVRTLFHRMDERDVYTRFFRKLRGLSNQDVQRLCNLNHETEVAFVAVVGDREHPQVVAHSCYFVDPSTNLGETAFMIHPDWQGQGLGRTLQQHMAEHAAGRGVRGFVADVLATNAAMIRLAQRASSQVSTESESGSVRVTALF